MPAHPPRNRGSRVAGVGTGSRVSAGAYFQLRAGQLPTRHTRHARAGRRRAVTMKKGVTLASIVLCVLPEAAEEQQKRREPQAASNRARGGEAAGRMVKT